MNKKLWQNQASKLHPAIESYTVGGDYIYDNALVPYDLKASLAHAKMLKKIKVLNADELKKLEKAFDKVFKLWSDGDFCVEEEDEDVHTAIENYLVENCGDLGKKIHTGRSRNDQVLVAMHLLMKDYLDQAEDGVDGLVKILDSFRKRYGKIAMPGYTHMQRAMPMNITMWIDAHVASLKDDLKILKDAKDLIDQNPLGSAAGFGINGLKLDRAYTTKLLGFKKVMNPPLYCQNSRGKFAGIFIGAMSQIMMSLGKIANDLLLFTTQEFDFFKVDESCVTGSSIMPQKRNLDVMEVLRANVSVVQSYDFRVKQISTPLISGYHRDWQLTKGPVFESFSILSSSLEVCGIVFKGLRPNKVKFEAAMGEELFATDKVYEFVNDGMSFRDAYGKVKKELGVRKKEEGT